MDVKDLEILNRLDCKCGYKFSLKDIRSIDFLTDTHGFYGNWVKTYSIVKCPKCYHEVILLLKQRGQTWEIMNTAQRDIMENIVEKSLQEMQSVVKNIKKDTNEFICPECKRVFKSKSGLSSHMKTHNN